MQFSVSYRLAKYAMWGALLLPYMFVSSAVAEEFQDLYQIEFILFKQAEPDFAVLEYERASDELKTPDAFLSLYPYNTSAVSPYQRSHLKESAELSLSDTAERLTNKGYTVLKSGAWQETIPNDSRTLPLKLQSEGPDFRFAFWETNRSVVFPQDETDEVAEEATVKIEQYEGELVIRRSRYMHAELHIDYYFKEHVLYPSLLDYLSAPQTEAEPFTSLILPQALNDDALDSTLINVKSFTFKQSRRVKNGEIHYLDHPFLGMIITIQRIRESDSF